MNVCPSARSLSLCLAFSIALVGCSSSGSDTKASSSGGASSSTTRASSSAPGPAASSATAAPKPQGTKTAGEVELRSSKKKAAFTIELPEGLKDVSDFGGRRDYRKSKDAFDSFGFGISDTPAEWVKAGLDGTLEQLTKDPDFVKNKVKILDKGKTDTGWYFTHSLQEPSGKKAASVTLLVTKGDVTLTCRGEVEGALAENADESTKSMLETCKTLTITSP